MMIIKDAFVSFPGLVASDFANYLKVDYASDSATIDNAFYGAADYVEQIAVSQFSKRAITVTDESLNDDGYEIPYAGTIDGSVTVTYYDENNASQPLTPDSTPWLEITEMKKSVLHVVKSTMPTVYDRKDAITINLTIAPITTTPAYAVKTCIYQLGAYFYDCRINDKEPQMTVVEKLVLGVRAKEF